MMTGPTGCSDNSLIKEINSLKIEVTSLKASFENVILLLNRDKSHNQVETAVNGKIHLTEASTNKFSLPTVTTVNDKIHVTEASTNNSSIPGDEILRPEVPDGKHQSWRAVHSKFKGLGEQGTLGVRLM